MEDYKKADYRTPDCERCRELEGQIEKLIEQLRKVTPALCTISRADGKGCERCNSLELISEAEKTLKASTPDDCPGHCDNGMVDTGGVDPGGNPISSLCPNYTTCPVNFDKNEDAQYEV